MEQYDSHGNFLLLISNSLPLIMVTWKFLVTGIKQSSAYNGQMDMESIFQDSSKEA